MSSRRLFAFWIGVTILLASLATFHKARSQPSIPSPLAAESRAGGGLTVTADPLAPASSRTSKARRPADPGRGADPGKAPVLKHVVETTHYRVSSEISKELCDEAAALLERAWPIWCARFDLDEGYDAGPGLLPVRIWGTDQALYRAIQSEISERVSCLGFVPYVDYRLFACRYGNDYEFRRILLHEGMHQFLYRLVGSSAARRLPRWYDEGCAHESEKHVLDGERLELFQHTGGTYSTQIERARVYFDQNGLKVAKFISGSQVAPGDDFRSCGWAIVHFFRTGATPEEAAWFRDYEAALHWGSRYMRESAVQQLADSDEVTKHLVAFLASIAPKPESR